MFNPKTFQSPTEQKSERRNKSGGTKEMGVVEAFSIKTHTLNYNQSVKKVYLYASMKVILV